MKKALVVATIVGFISSFEKNDIIILQNMGYEVHYACNTYIYNNANKVQDLDSTGVIKHHIPFQRSPFSIDNVKVYSILLNLMKKEKFDLVHCHTPVGGLLGRLAASKTRVPQVLYTAHGFHFFKGAPKKNWLLYYPVEKYLSKKTDILVTINNEDYCLAKSKFFTKEIKRIHGVGIDLSRFGSSIEDRDRKRGELGAKASDIVLLSVGELDRDKNHQVVLEAMKELSQKGFKYYICGTGKLREAFDSYIKDNNLQESVFFLGYRKDIPEILAAADIYVFPSLFEGLSVALMEAVAAKKPIVCSQVRGNVDTVVSGESYFSPYSSDELVRVIERVAKLDTVEMVEANYRNLEQYHFSNVQEEMKKIYRLAETAIKQ